MRSGILFVALVLIGISASASATDSLVAYWPMDGNAQDVSGNNRHGVEVNGPAWSTDGYFAGCVSLDGIDDSIEIAGFKGLGGSSSRTCAAWINTTEPAGEIITWGEEDYGGRWIIRVNEGGQLRAEVKGGNIIGTTVINDGTWHHVVVVLEDDGDPDIIEAKLYVDGHREVISSSVDEPVNTGDEHDVQIGVYPPTGRYFTGMIDDVRIYDAALSEAEVIELYVTTGDSILISTAEQLIAMGTDPNMMDKSFILTADIDLSAYTFNRAVIAPDTDIADDGEYVGTAFSGKFNGNHHTIMNLTIQNGTEYQGLFGCIEDTGCVINLGIENCHIDFSEMPYLDFKGTFTSCNKGMIYGCYAAGTISCGDNSSVIGGFAGINFGSIKRCYATGQINGPAGAIGGFIGVNEEDGSIAECYAATSIDAESALGGFCGLNRGQINTSYATGDVTGSLSYGHFGGFCGANSYPGLIENCYATGDVTATNGGYIGGFGGANEGVVAHCYATGQGIGNPYRVGGLFAEYWIMDENDIINCFWDIESSGITDALAPIADDPNPIGTFGKTTALMQQNNTFIFAGWDFVGESVNGQEDVWRICSNGSSYPQLSWEFEDGGMSGCDDPLPAGVYAGGAGTVDDPYLISEPIHLYTLTVRAEDWASSFLVTADIDLAGLNMVSIGQDTDYGFMGVFDGNGHTISNMTINTPDPQYWYCSTGLFASIGKSQWYWAGIVKNLHLENASVAGYRVVGALAGSLECGEVINCSSTGSVLAQEIPMPGIRGVWAGGLIGIIRPSDCSVRSCFSSCSVSAVTQYEFDPSCAGGFAGEIMSDVTDCYATGDLVSATIAGGFAGSIYDIGVRTNCYSTSFIDEDADMAGGFAGSYQDGAIAVGCFWDVEASGVESATRNGGVSGITGKTTEQMQEANTFLDTGWDFVGEDVNGSNNHWRMCVDGVDYPRLSWEFAKNGDFACGDGVDMGDLAALALAWLTDASFTPGTFNTACDANGDGQINLLDFEVLSGHWE